MASTPMAKPTRPGASAQRTAPPPPRSSPTPGRLPRRTCPPSARRWARESRSPAAIPRGWQTPIAATRRARRRWPARECCSCSRASRSRRSGSAPSAQIAEAGTCGHRSFGGFHRPGLWPTQRCRIRIPTCPRPWPSIGHAALDRRRRRAAAASGGAERSTGPVMRSALQTPVSGNTSCTSRAAAWSPAMLGDDRAHLLVAGSHQEGRRAAIGFAADDGEIGFGLRELGDAVRRHGAAGMEIRIDQRRQRRRRLDRRIDSTRSSRRNDEVGTETGGDHDAVDGERQWRPSKPRRNAHAVSLALDPLGGERREHLAAGHCPWHSWRRDPGPRVRAIGR